MRHRAHIALSCLLAVLFAVEPASAQNVAAAEALFNKAKEALAKGDFKTACPAFRESYRLDPAPGALYALASCHADAGEIATAVVRYDEYLRVYAGLPPAQQAKHLERQKTAKAQRAALALEVPELTLVLPATAPAGTRVTQDGVELSAVSLGLALPVDPGEHVVTTQAPGGPLTEQRFTVARKEKKQLELPVRLKGGEAPPSAVAEPPKEPVGQRPPVSQPPATTLPVSPPPVAESSAEGAAETPPQGGLSGQRVGAYVSIGVGAAGLLVGVITGVLVTAKTPFIEDHCRDIGDGRAACDQAGLDTANSAQTLGAVSTVGVGVGLAALAAGGVLLLTEKKPDAVGNSNADRQVRFEFMGAGPWGAMAGLKGVW